MGLTHATKWLLIRAIVADPALTASAVRVAIALLVVFHNIKTGRCDPSFASIAKAAGLTRRGTAIDAVRQLEEAGWLVVERAGEKRRPGVYRFLTDRIPVVLKEYQPSPATGAPTDQTGPLREGTGAESGPEQAFRAESPKRPKTGAHAPKDRGRGAWAPHRHAGVSVAEALRNLNLGEFE